MANTTIKITQLQNIGNDLAANTLLPVVNTTSTAITQKVTVGNVANFVLNQAGNLLPPAGLANLSYSVVNAAQPNITSVGTLNVSTLKITGGTNGYVLQTDGTGNLSWGAGPGGGNGEVAGLNSQVQFNDNGNFGGSIYFTWDEGNQVLSATTLRSTNLEVQETATIVDLNATGNIVTEANVTANWVIGDYISGNANPLTYIPGANVVGAVPYADTANSVDVSNVAGVGNIAVLNLTGSSTDNLRGDGTWGNTITWVTAPVSNTSLGTSGQVAYDTGGNLYVCVSSNTWSKFTGTLSW